MYNCISEFESDMENYVDEFLVLNEEFEEKMKEFFVIWGELDVLNILGVKIVIEEFFIFVLCKVYVCIKEIVFLYVSFYNDIVNLNILVEECYFFVEEFCKLDDECCKFWK